MARALDFGEPDDPAMQLKPESSSRLQSCSVATLSWNRQGQRIKTHILGKALVDCGRASDRDICLRICPTTAPENADKTRQISSLHFLVRYVGDRLQVIDKGSTNGTSLSSQGTLQPNVPADLKDGDRITVAEVLTLAVEFVARVPPVALDEEGRKKVAEHLEDADWLTERLIGLPQPGFLDFARLRRLGNLPEEEYVLLFGTGIVGSSKRAMITVDAETTARPAVRTLDLGDATPDYPAAFYWENGGIHIRSHTADQVRVNGAVVRLGEHRILSDGNTVEVIGQSIQISVKP